MKSEELNNSFISFPSSVNTKWLLSEMDGKADTLESDVRLDNKSNELKSDNPPAKGLGEKIFVALLVFS